MFKKFFAVVLFASALVAMPVAAASISPIPECFPCLVEISPIPECFPCIAEISPIPECFPCIA